MKMVLNILAIDANLNACSDTGIINALSMVGIALNIIKIVVPLILIVMGMIDMTKAVIASDQDALKKNLNVFVRRCIAAILVFITPSLLNGIFTLIDGFDEVRSEYSVCVSCVLDYSGGECPGLTKVGASE